MDRPSRTKSHPAGSISSSQPGGPPCWASSLAFGLIGRHRETLRIITVWLCVRISLYNPERHGMLGYRWQRIYCGSSMFMRHKSSKKSAHYPGRKTQRRPLLHFLFKMSEALLDEIFYRIERKTRENICVQISEFWAAGNLPIGLCSLSPIVQWNFYPSIPQDRSFRRRYDKVMISVEWG